MARGDERVFEDEHVFLDVRPGLASAFVGQIGGMELNKQIGR